MMLPTGSDNQKVKNELTVLQQRTAVGFPTVPRIIYDTLLGAFFFFIYNFYWFYFRNHINQLT